jgi:glucitol/sorbitol PTS system EIIA component
MEYKYKTKVVEIGPLVNEFIKKKIVVFFKKGAPQELVEFSIIHEPEAIFKEVELGDQIIIDNKQFTVLAIGNVANKNICELGHLVLKFNGSHTVRLPGEVCVEKKKIPEIKIGSIIEIFQDGQK